MEIKELIKQAVEAQITGNKAAFETTMKQVVTTKVGEMVNQQSSAPQQPLKK